MTKESILDDRIPYSVGQMENRMRRMGARFNWGTSGKKYGVNEEVETGPVTTRGPGFLQKNLVAGQKTVHTHGGQAKFTRDGVRVRITNPQQNTE